MFAVAAGKLTVELLFVGVEYLADKE